MTSLFHPKEESTYRQPTMLKRQTSDRLHVTTIETQSSHP
jgi:hypothetical protein